MTGRTDKATGGRGTPRLRRDGGSGGWDNLPPSNPPPTGEEFDALTDLFLGEVGNGPGSAAAPIIMDSPVSPGANGSGAGAGGGRNGRSQPVLRLAGAADDIDLDEEPAPAPAFTPAKTKIVPAETRREASTPARETRGTPAAATSAIVECIVLGHLPVLAAAWGAQYVREVAQASGRPVAYLRLQHGYASIELIGGDGSSEALPTAKSLGEGLKLAAERTHRWVVRADAGEEARLAASPLVRVITLLTGVDEAAVVAAYGSVKSLAASLGAPSADASSPMMRVAAMGAAPEKAMPAAKRLADAITRFVGREVDTAVCSARIASARPSEVLFTGRTDIEAGAAMELLAKIADETTVIEPSPRLVSDAPAHPAPPQLRRADLELEAELPELPSEPIVERKPKSEITPPPRDTQHVAAAEAKRPAAPAFRAAAAVAPVAAPVEAAASDPEAERSEVLADAPSALALLLPGLRPVSIRCPYAEGIEFAVDRSGTLHLLSRIEDGAEERALSQLLVSGAWADAHASMLAASLGQSAALVASGMSARAELHLFTDRPKASRRLLETSVNVHLLARVEVAGQSGWYCTDLN